MEYKNTFNLGFILEDTILLKNGSILKVFELAGVDFLQTEIKNRHTLLNNYYQLLKSLSFGYTYSFHLIRTYDNDLCQAYNEITNTEIIREEEATKYFRDLISNQFSLGYGKKNKIYLSIISRPNKKNYQIKQLLKSLTIFDNIIQKIKNEIEIRELNCEEIISINQFLFNGMEVDFNKKSNLLNSIPEILITEKPTFNKNTGILTSNSKHYKSFMLIMYPDAFAGFLDMISYINSNIHYRVTVTPKNKQSELTKSRRASRETTKDSETAQIKNTDETGFRVYIQTNSLETLKNRIVLTLSNYDEQLLIREFNEVKSYLLNHNATIAEDNIEYKLFGSQLFGECEQLFFSRIDHSELITNLLPLSKQKSNHTKAQILRLTKQGTLVAFEYVPDSVNHGFTIGRTGGGKDAEKITQILETFGLGINYFVIEIDPSYKWAIEALGGTYLDIDPSKSVINPFPSFTDKLTPEHVSIITCCLSPILTNNTELNTQENFIAEKALLAIYNKENKFADQYKSPSFDTYRKAINLVLKEPNLNKTQQTSGKSMVENLSSFIDSPSGEIFKQENNLNLNPTLCGVNLKKVTESPNKKLIIFYLSFLAMRFKLLAEKSNYQSVILLNELHEFSAVAPEITKNLIRQLARMGRKRNTFIQLVTQDIGDINLGAGVINSMTRRNFVHMPTGHEKVKEYVPTITTQSLNDWKTLIDPIHLKDYREQLINIGDTTYMLQIFLPKEILTLANTNPNALNAKTKIEAMTNSYKERINLLQQKGF